METVMETMGKIDYETAKKVRKLKEKGATYDEIEEQIGISRKSIAKILKMSEEEIEELKKREEKEVKAGEEGLKAKAKKQFFKEVSNWIADEAMENLKELIKNGMLVRELYEKKREEEFENAIQAARIEKTKNLALRILLLRYLRGEIDKYDLARRILVVTYA